MQIITTDTPAVAAGEAINTLIAEHTGPTLCLLSGGSALDVIKHIKESECRTIFIMGDERGSREPDINNYLRLQAVYDDHSVTQNCVPTVPEENESLEDFAKRISAKLQSIINGYDNPQVIHLMGMGSDGHTAGIFPMPEESFTEVYDRDPMYVPVHLESLTIDHRASVTPAFINQHVSHIIGYAAGESKKTTLQSLKNESKAMRERPAEIWKLKAGTRVFTDQSIE